MKAVDTKKRENTFDANRPIDYRNVELLRKFLTPHARALSKAKSNLPSKKQRELALAIKRARYMALIPYIGS
jgi:small subunit ribosomal protein S18